ncbi:MAG: PorP/SprF family type IX secretion system membrane protein [Bacteroidota bacterium]|nr:PorP/SprF family type IX secretion system membrane protein [Bacteroidota bacterium]
MRNGKKIAFCIVLLISTLGSYGQDIHFSQVDANPLFLNPALTGTMNTQYRAVISHRSQWNAFTNAYKTVAASIDNGRQFLFFPYAKIGMGLSVLSDRAGDGNYGRTSIFVPLSAQKSFFENRMLISVGAQAGIGQYSFDFNKLYWGNQFDGNRYEPALPSNETFPNNSHSYFDISSGIYLSWKTGNNFKLSGSWAVFHINEASNSFSDYSSEKISRKNIGFISSTVPLSSMFILHPAIYFQQQKTNKEIMPGAMLQIVSGNMIVQDFRAGLFFRNKDAIILRAIMVYKELQIGLSYDFTFSDLTVANNGRGGFELSLTYLFNLRKVIPEYPPKYCPDYI